MIRGKRVIVKARKHSIEVTLLKPNNLRADKIEVPLECILPHRRDLAQLEHMLVRVLPSYSRRVTLTYSRLSQ